MQTAPCQRHASLKSALTLVVGFLVEQEPSARWNIMWPNASAHLACREIHLLAV